MNSAILCVAILVCGVVVFAGCAPNQQYRTVFNPEDHSLPATDPTNAVIEATKDYRLGFVEFDDQGWFWSPEQKNAVEAMTRREMGLDSRQYKAAILVLFAHGWKNNAAYGNSNVNTFKTVLTQLNSLETALSQKEGRDPRTIIGIYAGWRGLSIKSDLFPPLGKETTFWARKSAAQRVGGYGAMTELMMDLEQLQRRSNESVPTNASRTLLIIVGHSFGADAVYNSISQIVTERFVDTIKQKPGELLKPVGDQVILLNPAFEAARFYDLAQLARSVQAYSPHQRPVLSVFQSEGDWATHDFFPIGQKIGTMFQCKKNGFQGKAIHESVGWFNDFISHELRYETNPPVLPPDAAGSPMKPHHLRTPDKIPAAAENIHAQRRAWRLASGPATTNVFGNCVLTSRKSYKSRDPIVVVSVDKQIMKDHDDIGNPVLINFLQEYIPFCDEDPSPNQPGP